MRADQAEERYVRLLRAFGRWRRTGFGREAEAAWVRAYRDADPRRGLLEPRAAEQFLLRWQGELRKEVEQVCSRVSKPELFFALRLLDPGRLATQGIRDPGGQHRSVAMATRRVATHAALLYARPPSEDYNAPYGGGWRPGEGNRLADAFLRILTLSFRYIWSHSYRAIAAAGGDLIIAGDGLREVPGETLALIRSLDERKNAYYSPFARIGEFSARAVLTREPDGASLLSARYQVSEVGGWSYDWVAWRLDPLREFAVGLDPELCRRAWGMTGVEFVCLLAGLCHLIALGLAERGGGEGFSLSSVVPLARAAVDGDDLLRHTAGYLRAAGYGPGDFDLAGARERFLWLADSTGKGQVADGPLKIQLGDTRHSYLLHRFGKSYAADLFHADHWLHRPLDLLASKMEGEQADAKGRRFEDRLWEYLASVGSLLPVPALRGRTIYRTRKAPAGDLDCPVALGRVLILIEAKAYLLRYPAEALHYHAVQQRWEESKRFLRRIGEVAQLLAAQRHRPAFREGMEGIAYILPLVCRPYPEWIHSLDEVYWLRKPDEAVGVRGVPRVLTPGEVHDFFAPLDEEQLLDAVGAHLIRVSDIPEILEGKGG